MPNMPVMPISNKRERQAFADAKQRCYNKNHKRYADWGGRGIEVWFKDFDHFFAVLGPRPEGHSLDRIDNDVHYCPGNVRWATREQQQHNRRKLKRNTSGTNGVRKVSAPGLITDRYQAYVNESGKFKQLYAGPSLQEAIKAREAYECLNQ